MKNTFDIPQRGFQKWRSGARKGDEEASGRSGSRLAPESSTRGYSVIPPEAPGRLAAHFKHKLFALVTTSSRKFTLSSNAATQAAPTLTTTLNMNRNARET